MPPLESDPHARLRHELRTPLTVIHGSAQRLGRMLAAMPSVSSADRTRLEARLAALDAATMELRDRIEHLTDDGAAEPPLARATRTALRRTQARIDASWALLRRVQQRSSPPD